MAQAGCPSWAPRAGDREFAPCSWDLCLEDRGQLVGLDTGQLEQVLSFLEKLLLLFPLLLFLGLLCVRLGLRAGIPCAALALLPACFLRLTPSLAEVGDALAARLAPRLLRPLLALVYFERALRLARSRCWACSLVLGIAGSMLQMLFLSASLQLFGVQDVAWLLFVSEPLGLDGDLGALLLGESLVTDVAALAMLGDTAASVLLGVVVGLLASSLNRQDSYEGAWATLSAELSFALGELLGVGGISAALFTGITVGWLQDRVDESLASRSFLTTAARLAEVVQFLVIGVCSVTVRSWAGIKLGLLAFLCVRLSRFMMLLLLMPIVNAVKGRQEGQILDFRHILILTHAGCCGGLSVVMSLTLMPYWSQSSTNARDATIVVIVGTTYFSSCTLALLLRALGMPSRRWRACTNRVGSEFRFQGSQRRHPSRLTCHLSGNEPSPASSEVELRMVKRSAGLDNLVSFSDEDIEFVMQEASCTRAEAVEALHACVDASTAGDELSAPPGAHPRVFRRHSTTRSEVWDGTASSPSAKLTRQFSSPMSLANERLEHLDLRATHDGNRSSLASAEPAGDLLSLPVMSETQRAARSSAFHMLARTGRLRCARGSCFPETHHESDTGDLGELSHGQCFAPVASGCSAGSTNARSCSARSPSGSPLSAQAGAGVARAHVPVATHSGVHDRDQALIDEEVFRNQYGSLQAFTDSGLAVPPMSTPRGLHRFTATGAFRSFSAKELVSRFGPWGRERRPTTHAAVGRLLPSLDFEG